MNGLDTRMRHAGASTDSRAGRDRSCGPRPSSLDDALATLEAAVERLERVTDRLEARFVPSGHDATRP